MTRVPATVLHFIDSGGLYGAESVLLNLSREMQASGRYRPIIGSIVGAPDEPDALHDKALELGFAAEKLVVRNGRLPLWVMRHYNPSRDLDSLAVGDTIKVPLMADRVVSQR